MSRNAIVDANKRHAALLSLTNRQHLYDRGDYEEALRVISDFCCANGSLKVGLNGFTGAEILAVLKPSVSEGDHLAMMSLSPVFLKSDQATQNSDLVEPTIDPVDAYLFADEDIRQDVTRKATASKNLVKFSSDDMDFLAIAFTAVKISYLSGMYRNAHCFTFRF